MGNADRSPFQLLSAHLEKADPAVFNIIEQVRCRLRCLLPIESNN